MVRKGAAGRQILRSVFQVSLFSSPDPARELRCLVANCPGNWETKKENGRTQCPACGIGYEIRGQQYEFVEGIPWTCDCGGVNAISPATEELRCRHCGETKTLPFPPERGKRVVAAVQAPWQDIGGAVSPRFVQETTGFEDFETLVTEGWGLEGVSGERITVDALEEAAEDNEFDVDAWFDNNTEYEGLIPWWKDGLTTTADGLNQLFGIEIDGIDALDPEDDLEGQMEAKEVEIEEYDPLSQYPWTQT